MIGGSSYAQLMKRLDQPQVQRIKNLAISFVKQITKVSYLQIVLLARLCFTYGMTFLRITNSQIKFLMTLKEVSYLLTSFIQQKEKMQR